MLVGRTPVSLGFRVHSGWAVMVALAGNTVVERWRIELAGDGMPVQPYHAAEPLPFAEAELLIRSCEDISLRFARQTFERLSGHEVRAACVLASSGRPLPDLKSILASHPLIHTAEGELYREALRRAASHFQIPLVQAREKEVLDRVPAQFRRQIDQYGRILGPPWRQDEKLATAAAYLARP